MSKAPDPACDSGPRSWRPRSWRPAPAIAASLALHGLGLLTLAVSPRLWPWALSALAANQGILAAAGSWPRSRLLGPNITRVVAGRDARGLVDGAASSHSTSPGNVALTFDDGPDPEVTPRVLDLLDQRRHRATFFCVGQRAEAYPDVVREIAARGHSVENHTHRHSYAFGWFGPWRLAREIDRAQLILGELAGRRPRFFRAPAGARSPLLEPVLARRGLHLVSWTRRGFDAVDRNPDRILRRLVRGLRAGDLLLLHDGSFGSGRAPRSRPVLSVLPALLSRLDQAGLRSVALTEENAIP